MWTMQRQFVQQKVVQPDLVNFLVTFVGIVNTECVSLSALADQSEKNTSLMSLCSRPVNMYVKCDSMVWMFQKMVAQNVTHLVDFPGIFWW
jgi:hypothetical protein